MRSLDDFAHAKLSELEHRSLRRRLRTTHRVPEGRVERDGRSFVSFSCNDYLNLAHDPRVREAATRALHRQGAGAGASRLVTGNHDEYDALERALAHFKGSEAAMVFGSGYLANLGVIPALVGPGDLVLLDEWCHACLFAGAKLSGATLRRFAHNDARELRALLHDERPAYPRCLVLTEGVFSMDGDLAPLAEMAPLCETHDAWLLVDDAHGFGVVGAGGRGSAHVGDAPVRVPLQVGTLSKAGGSYGGYLCASAVVVELLHSRARTGVYSTGLPPATVAAARQALEIIEDEPWRGERAVAQAQAFAACLGLPRPQSAIVPVLLGSARRSLAASAFLEERGFLVVAIRPPTVPEDTSRLRFAFHSAHRPEDVVGAAEALKLFLAGYAGP